MTGVSDRCVWQVVEGPGTAGTHRRQGVIRAPGRYRQDILARIAEQTVFNSPRRARKLPIDYNRCLWHAIMRSLDLNIQGLASVLGVSRQTVHRWFRGRSPHPDHYLKIVEQLTCRRAKRGGFAGAYDVLADETGQDRFGLQHWAGAPEPMQEGNRLAALGIWHKLGYPIKSYRVVDFHQRVVEVRQARRIPSSRWVEGLGYLPPNPFELWPWPDPDESEAIERERPSLKGMRAQVNAERGIGRGGSR